jgi:hypothetical protein
MTKPTKLNQKVKFSKADKIMASHILDKHERKQFIKLILKANTAQQAAKNSKLNNKDADAQ